MPVLGNDSARRFHVDAWKGVKNRVLGMAFLVSMGSNVAYVYGWYTVIRAVVLKDVDIANMDMFMTSTTSWLNTPPKCSLLTAAHEPVVSELWRIPHSRLGSKASFGVYATATSEKGARQWRASGCHMHVKLDQECWPCCLLAPSLFVGFAVLRLNAGFPHPRYQPRQQQLKRRYPPTCTMNYGALVQLPQSQAPPLSSSAIKMLRQSVRQQLPLRFRVASTTVEKRIVVYNCDVSSVTTSNSWRVSYRYSEFASFAKKIEEQSTCQDGRCSGSCEAIREFLWACFPQKRLSIMSKSARTIADRKNKFETVVQYLLRCVLLPGSAMKCLHVRQNLSTSLFEFLGVQHDADKRSLLHVFVDNCQAASSKCSEPECRDNLHSNASTVDSIETSQCTICLEDVELENADEDCCLGPSSSIVLPCQHAFHRECIFEWLLFQFQCPVCRARVGPRAVTSYCQEKNHTFQWWLSDFEEDPLNTKQAQPRTK
ncbi:hypothetical protein PHYPSEUDO_008522 [Phytophthora pseudosyringae]|uniref:RING-type domain-containing protein n=1 Tax=Phytophthora pseudosyringae TaxID=221518 RepID=A0A8T1VE31_9STRA|nr:hypothetical protein PHYPSEUDO_008522 [Phytophthora pseudosyringae]